MSVPSAFGFLIVASARNVVREAVRGLRSPRRFFAALLGAAWLLYLFVIDPRLVAGRSNPWSLLEPQGAAWLAELLTLAAVSILVLAAWLLGREDAPLAFSEAEIQLLFPAPLTRRQLVLYKLSRAAAAGLLVTLAFGLFFGRGGLAGRAASALGAWLVLNVVTFHGTGAALTRASLAQHGVPALRRRVLPLAVAMLALAGAAVGLRRAPALEAFSPDPAGVLAWSRAVVDTEPLAWVLYPLRVTLAAAFEPSPGRLALALVLVVVHVAWVLASDAAFEEGAIAQARRIGARLEAARSGAFRVRRGGVPLWPRLGVPGRPETAFLWKAVVRGSRFVSIRVIAGVAAVGMAFAMVMVIGAETRAVGLAVLAWMVFVMTALLGPLFVSGDLRRDLPHLELLRLLPVRGHQLIVGEILLPLAQLTAIQWAALAAAAVLSEPMSFWTLGERVAVEVALGIAAPAVSAAGFVAMSGVAVLYPGWFPRRGDVAVSLERTGMMVMLGLAQLAVTLLALLPAGIVAGGAFMLLRPALGMAAAPIAAALGAAAIAAALLPVVRLLGRAIERLDPEP